MAGQKRSRNTYASIIEEIFKSHFKAGATRLEFGRSEIEEWAKKLDLPVKNLGDLLYSFRYRATWPEVISKTQPKGKVWAIEGAGKARYAFVLVPEISLTPRPGTQRISVPDSTPQIIAKYALTDEQAVLAKVRYNRLVDIFLGITAYSLQNHLRTTVKDVGQIEIDEVYVGIKKDGQQFVVPVQAKGGSDRIGTPQLQQDAAFCSDKYPRLVARLVAVQRVMDAGQEVIVMFEISAREGKLSVVDERHYVLVPASEMPDGRDEATVTRSSPSNAAPSMPKVNKTGHDRTRSKASPREASSKL